MSTTGERASHAFAATPSSPIATPTAGGSLTRNAESNPQAGDSAGVRDVWICPIANGHIQATGRDARGRKQYRYHPAGAKCATKANTARCCSSARRCRRSGRGWSRPGARRLAAREGAGGGRAPAGDDADPRRQRGIRQDQQELGLTTLRNRHVKVEGSKRSISIPRQERHEHHIDLRDRRLARSCGLPGPAGPGAVPVSRRGRRRRTTIGSDDVNDYLREITGEEFTAKDFRTWAGTVLAALALREFESSTPRRRPRSNVVQAVEAVAKMLGNTPAVCRKCYIHPAIFDGYLDGSLLRR